MISDVINMTETGDFETFCGVIFVNFLLIPWRRTFIRKNRRVVNYNASWDYCVKERVRADKYCLVIFLLASLRALSDLARSASFSCRTTP